MTTQSLPQSLLARKLQTLFAIKPIWLVAAIVVLVGGWRSWVAYQATQLPGQPVDVATLEQKWGIQVKQIGVTADGGLIDFRLMVTDPDKALPLFSVENRPILVVENNGAVVDSLMHPPHSHDLLPGQTHFFLYNNTNGAIQPGLLVSVIIGDLRLEHIRAK